MSWITVALLSTILLGVINVFDSYFVSKRMSGYQAFLIPTGILHLTFGLVIILIHPIPWGVGATPITVAFVSGMLRSLGVVLMLQAMRSEEVSRIIPVTNTYPIFVAILAVPLLDEVLGLKEWLAIFITVAGAVLISARWDGQGGRAYFHKSFVALMAVSLLMGVGNTTSKYALDHISFWNMYSINAFCFFGAFLLFSLRPRVLKDLRDMDRRNLTLTLIFFMETGALIGIIMSFWAMEKGPISLVSTVLGIRPAIVFLIAVALTHVFPFIVKEHLTRGVVITKSISIALIIAGVTIINL